MERSADKSAILKLIDSLPEDQKLATLLYYSDDLSIAEIAHITATPPGTVKSRLLLARQKIRAQLEGD